MRLYSVDGVEVKLRSGVYRPSFSTKMLLSCISSMDGINSKVVLDLGCGSGILAIVAFRKGARYVIAIDVSYRAAKTARENFSRNNILEGLDVIVGDVVSCLRPSSIDVIICNPPMTPAPTPVMTFTWGGFDGKAFLRKLLTGLRGVIKPNGQLLLAVSSLVGVGWVISRLKSIGFKLTVLNYATHRFGKLLNELVWHISTLHDSSIIYIRDEPHWTLVIVKGELQSPQKDN